MNAKELILAKINSGQNLAGTYLHLIMQGFDFMDIAKFMTSPVPQLIADMETVNVFDDYNENMPVTKSLKYIEEGPNLFDFFDNTPKWSDEADRFISEVMNIQADIAGSTYNKSNGKLNFKQAQVIVSNYMWDKINGKDVDALFKSEKMTPAKLRLLQTIDFIAEKLRNSGLKVEELKEDLEEFKNVYTLAKETQKLGTFYGLNQGIKSKNFERMMKNNSWEAAITDREAVYAGKDMLERILADKPYLLDMYSAWELAAIIAKADELGISKGGFNFKKFIQDAVDGEYRQTTINYYNLIKGTWNIFDMITRIPHFKALFDVLDFTEDTLDNLIAKSSLTNTIRRDYINENPKYNRMMSEQQLKAIESYIDDLMISKWLNEEAIVFTIPVGQEYFNKYGDRTTAKVPTELELSTEHGRASFKLWFESTFINSLKQNQLPNPEGTVTNKGLADNLFIKDLMLVDQNTGGHLTNLLKTPLNMNSIKTDSDKFKYQNYIKDLLSLQKVQFQGIPVSDWFMLYNLIVNKNRYGEDRLTTLFKGFIKQTTEDSVIKDYLGFVGKFDSEQIKLDELYSLDDVLFTAAPVVAKSREHLVRNKYIKVYNPKTKEFDYKVYHKGQYKLLPLKDFIPGTVNGVISESKQADFYNYFTLTRPLKAKANALIDGLSSTSDSIVTATLQQMLSAGTIVATIKC